jgi:hypothetical protein
VFRMSCSVMSQGMLWRQSRSRKGSSTLSTSDRGSCEK